MQHSHRLILIQDSANQAVVVLNLIIQLAVAAFRYFEPLIQALPIVPLIQPRFIDSVIVPAGVIHQPYSRYHNNQHSLVLHLVAPAYNLCFYELVPRETCEFTFYILVLLIQ